MSKIDHMSWYLKIVTSAPAQILYKQIPGKSGFQLLALYGPGTFNARQQLSQLGFLWDPQNKFWTMGVPGIQKNPAVQQFLQSINIPVPSVDQSQQQQPMPQPQKGGNWYEKNVRKQYILAVEVGNNSPVVMTKAPDGWNWFTADELNGTELPSTVSDGEVALMFKTVRDQNNKPYMSYNPEELFKIFESLNQPAQPQMPQEDTQEVAQKKQANIIPEVKMSVEQRAIETDFAQTNNSIMIDALAGSGKTTMLKHLSWKFGTPDQRWLYMVFNTKNKVEAKGKFPSHVTVDTTNGFLGRILDNAAKKGLIPETKRIKSLEPQGKVSKADRVPDKSALLVDGPDFARMMTQYKLTPLMPANHNMSQSESATVRALLKQIRGDFRKAVLTLGDLCKAYAIDPRDKANMQSKIVYVLDRYDIDYELMEVKERIAKYSERFRAGVLRTLQGLLGFDIMTKTFRNEVIQSVTWLLNECMPGQSEHKFNYKGRLHRLGDYRDFSDDLWFSAINAPKLDWTNGVPGGFSHVLADEVQDFNECQKIALSHMKGKGAKVVAVGDPNQSIYRFRGADASAFGNISKMLGSNKHTLSLNFRSKPAIINFSNTNTHVNNLKVGLKVKEEDLVGYLGQQQTNPADVEYLQKAGQMLGGNVTPQALKAAIDAGQLDWPPALNGQATNEVKEYENIFAELQAERAAGNNIQTAFIARTNAPLANAALKLLGQGIPFVIVGKDIANDLVRHIEWLLNARSRTAPELDVLDNNSPLSMLERKLPVYLADEKGSHANKSSKRGYLQDLEDTTQALTACIQQYTAANPNVLQGPAAQPGANVDDNFYDGDEPAPQAPAAPPAAIPQGGTIGAFKAWLNEKLGGLDLESSESDIAKYDETVEKDKKKAPVVLTTAHKSKGLEFGRVFVLRNDLFPHPKAKRPEDLQQEANGKYVTYTRAMDQLHIVKLDGQPGYKK